MFIIERYKKFRNWFIILRAFWRNDKAILNTNLFNYLFI